MEVCKCTGGRLEGVVSLPPSKSMAHRAIFCAALANGRSVIRPIELSNDMRASINAVSALGAGVECAGDSLIIEGVGDGVSSNAADNEPVEINCIESGSTLRFVIPVAAAVGINAKFTGTGSLPSRPIGMYADLLPQAGVECVTDGGLPFICRGKLHSGEYRIRGDVSSQFITGLLLALPLCEGDSSIILTTQLQSSAYVDMTIRCMRDFGVDVERTSYGWHIRGGQSYLPQEYEVEGDWSHAGFFLAAGAMGSSLTLRGLRMDSVQGDRAAVDLFRGFGANISESADGLKVSGGKLHGQRIDASQNPDLVPCLAVCAALCEGVTVIAHAERLRIKECDRITCTARLINSLGGRAKELPDGLEIEGVSGFVGGRADGCNDHRIVMSAAVAALRASGDVLITESDSINKTYPSFFDVYNSLGGNANVINLG